MLPEFFAIDVETANTDRSSICQIGYVHFRHGREVTAFETLVNPLAAFLPRNIEIHGIRPEQVQDAPSLAEVYDRLKADLDGAVLVHHGDFDWQAFGSAALVHDLPLLNAKWVSSKALAEEAWPHAGSHKLNVLAQHLGITFQHHDALNDARTAGLVAWAAMEAGARPAPRTFRRERFAGYTHKYPIVSKTPTWSPVTAGWMGRERAIEAALSKLRGLLLGILSDGAVEDLETEELRVWAARHEELFSAQPWSEVLAAIGELEWAGDAVERLEAVEDLVWLAERLGGTYFDEAAADLHTLEGLLAGMLSDGHLADEEIRALETWLAGHAHLRGHLVYDQVQQMVEDVLADQTITPTERHALTQLIHSFTEVHGTQARGLIRDSLASSAPGSPDAGTLQIFDDVPIAFSDRAFVLSGNFAQFDSKAAVEAEIARRGGATAKSVTRKCHYLVVGELGSEAWRFSRFGRKIERAIQLRDKGASICIISESTLRAHL